MSRPTDLVGHLLVSHAVASLPELRLLICHCIHLSSGQRRDIISFVWFLYDRAILHELL